MNTLLMAAGWILLIIAVGAILAFRKMARAAVRVVKIDGLEP